MQCRGLYTLLNLYLKHAREAGVWVQHMDLTRCKGIDEIP